MTALPINPTDEQLYKAAKGDGDTYAGASERLFQAGVEAERARAAAEVRDLHHISDIELFDGDGEPIAAAVCDHCVVLMGDHDDVPVPDAVMWPCATIRALEAAS